MTEYAWYKLANGREVYRPVWKPKTGRSDLASPYFRSDSIDPIRGFDGKMHDSLSGFRKTLLPSGNPKGERYYELGNGKIEHKPVEFDKAKRIEHIKQAIHDVETGNVPDFSGS
jgi:hypothetical protein